MVLGEPKRRSSYEVGIRAVEPVLPHRAEDVEDFRVLDHLDAVLGPRGNLERLPAADDDGVAGDREGARARQDVADLLVIVGVGRYDRAALEVEARDRHPRRREIAAVDARRELSRRKIVPPVMCGASHGSHTLYKNPQVEV